VHWNRGFPEHKPTLEDRSDSVSGLADLAQADLGEAPLNSLQGQFQIVRAAAAGFTVSVTVADAVL
jgi:hypothetical protein